jgi:hypothetical protein
VFVAQAMLGRGTMNWPALSASQPLPRRTATVARRRLSTLTQQSHARHVAATGPAKWHGVSNERRTFCFVLQYLPQLAGGPITLQLIYVQLSRLNAPKFEVRQISCKEGGPISGGLHHTLAGYNLSDGYRRTFHKNALGETGS